MNLIIFLSISLLLSSVANAIPINQHQNSLLLSVLRNGGSSELRRFLQITVGIKPPLTNSDDNINFFKWG